MTAILVMVVETLKLGGVMTEVSRRWADFVRWSDPHKLKTDFKLLDGILDTLPCDMVPWMQSHDSQNFQEIEVVQPGPAWMLKNEGSDRPH